MANANTLIDNSDGSGRDLRPRQIAALQFVAHSYSAADNIAITAPTGSGKSLIARAVQREYGGAIVTPDNGLLKQYCASYPELNHWIGKDHYKCDKTRKSCHAMINQCRECPWTTAKTRMEAGDDTVFNPMSLVFARHAHTLHHNVTIIDEADLALNLMQDLAGQVFPRSRASWPDDILEQEVLFKWLKNRYEVLLYLDKSMMTPNTATNLRKFETFYLTLKSHPDEYVWYIEEKEIAGYLEKYLHIRPLFLPKGLVNGIFGNGKKLFMSATLFSYDLKQLSGESAYLDLPSDIPVDNRKIRYMPANFAMNHRTDIKRVAELINATIKANRARGTIIHVPYSYASRLAPLLHYTTLLHDKKSKPQILADFKRRGGVLLACGMAYGVDLPGDLCRVNIVPKMIGPNMLDPWVAKRMALPDGNLWYALTCMRTTAQQLGRAVRGPEDWATNIVLDPAFLGAYTRCNKYLPQSFKESIEWRS
jgi:Rad3-related DNA helicase